MSRLLTHKWKISLVVIPNFSLRKKKHSPFSLLLAFMTVFALSSCLFALGILLSPRHTKPRQTEQTHKRRRAFAICHILLLVANCDYTGIIIMLFNKIKWIYCPAPIKSFSECPYFQNNGNLSLWRHFHSKFSQPDFKVSLNVISGCVCMLYNWGYVLRSKW